LQLRKSFIACIIQSYSMGGCLGKVGSVAADIVTPLVYRSTDALPWCFWVAVFLNLIAFVIVFVLNIIDAINDERRRKLRYFRKNNEQL